VTLGTAVLAASCASAPATTHTEYRYSLAAPTEAFRPGQSLPLTWKASAEVVLGAAPSAPFTRARVCVALAGPYPSVEDLKSQKPAASTCPIGVPGIVMASGVVDADITRGTPIDQSLSLPASLAPGFYNLLSVFAYESGSHGGAMSAASVIRVIAAP
jgi:hypothetical protein